MITQLYVLAWLTFSPLFYYVEGFSINEIPNTLSLIYNDSKLNEKHIAFPLKFHAKCYSILELYEGESVITNDGIECYVFNSGKPMYEGTRIQGSAKAYYRFGKFYTVSEYNWKLMELN